MKTEKQFTRTNGFKQKIWFANNYGISLINVPFTASGDDFSYGLECALIHKEEENIISNNKKFSKFCHGDSVKAYLDGEDLLKALKLVKKLKCR